MEKIVIKKINFFNKEIKFNPGENYIIGSNATGKTTFFNTIQYVLGIKNDIKYLFNIDPNFYIECIVGNKLIQISRNQNIIIFEGDLSKEVRVNSKELGKVYFDLLKPYQIPQADLNVKVTLDILRGLFLSDGRLNDLSFRKNNIYKNILGFNQLEKSNIKKDIEKFNNKIKTQKEKVNNIEEYIKEVMELIDKNNLNENKKDEFINILKKPMEIKHNRIEQNKKLLEKANKVLNEKNIKLNNDLKENVKILEDFFEKVYNRLISDNTVINKKNQFKIMDVMESEFTTYSLGQNMILKLSLLLTLYTHSKENNYYGCGLLINDCITSFFSNSTRKKTRNFISKLTNENSLQYIEFSLPLSSIPKDKVILNLDKDQVVIR